MGSFIVSITYIKPVAEVDALMEPHVGWLREQHKAGHLIGWGRKVPREGGILIAVGESRESVEELAGQDPFVTGGVAKVEVIEWAPSFLDDSIAGIKR